MTHTSENVEATEQLQRARAALGEALGLMQDIPGGRLDVDRVSAALARSVKDLFTVQSLGLASPASATHIGGAMQNLRDTLRLLQDVRVQDPALERTTSTVARSLAMIYPISKVIEAIAAEHAEHPIALTAGRPSAPGAGAPIPLTATRPKGPEPEHPIPLQKTDAKKHAHAAETKKHAAETKRHSVGPKPKRKATGAERRISERRVIDADIGIQSETNFFTGFSQDISSGGLFIATYDTLPIGSPLNVNFTIPDGPVLSLSGVVRWVREYRAGIEMEPGMGVQFDDLSDRDRTAINRYMKRRQPMFYEED